MLTKDEDDDSASVKHSNSYEKQPTLVQTSTTTTSQQQQLEDLESASNQFMSKNPHMQDMSRQQTPVQQQQQLPRSPTSPTRPVSSVSSTATSTSAQFAAAAVNNTASQAIMTTLMDEIQNLKSELDLVKRESAKTNAEHKSVQSELAELKRGHDEQMRKMQKRLQDLVNEIDEEKKTRLALQVELERLKKTIND